MADCTVLNTFALLSGATIVVQGGVGSTSVVVKSADETVTSSTTLQNDDHLVASLASNAVYALRMLLICSSGASATPGIKYGFTMPSGATMSLSEIANYGNFTSYVFEAAYTNESSPTTDFVSQVKSSGNGKTGVLVTGIVRTSSTAGSLQLRWAQNSSSGTGTVVHKDSHIALTRVS